MTHVAGPSMESLDQQASSINPRGHHSGLPALQRPAEEPRDPGSTRCTRSRPPCPASPQTWERRPGVGVAHARLAHAAPSPLRGADHHSCCPALTARASLRPAPALSLTCAPSPSNPRASLWHRGAATAGARVASRTSDHPSGDRELHDLIERCSPRPARQQRLPHPLGTGRSSHRRTSARGTSGTVVPGDLARPRSLHTLPREPSHAGPLGLSSGQPDSPLRSPPAPSALCCARARAAQHRLLEFLAPPP